MLGRERGSLNVARWRGSIFRSLEFAFGLGNMGFHENDDDDDNDEVESFPAPGLTRHVLERTARRATAVT